MHIDDHELTGLDDVTAALFDTQKGPVIGIFHEYTHLGNERSIHAAGEMEWFKCKVDDRSKVVGGAQRIETPDGYVYPLSIESGWFKYTPSGFLLMMTCSSSLMFSSHHLTFGMLLFWIMVLLLHFLMKSIKKLMSHCFRTLFMMNLETFNNKWYSTWMCFGNQAQQKLGSICFMHTFMRATLLNKTGNH